MHQKRTEMPRTWPIPRKGTKYLALASHAKKEGISLLFVLRDILKLANTRKEVKYFMFNGDIKVNNIVRKDENFPLQVFDVISLDKLKKKYRLNILNKKFSLEEVSGDAADKKIVKILGKTILPKGLVQMNLQDGQNFISKETFALGDSVLVNTKANKIEKILPLKEGANVEVISGKHAGEKGKLKQIISFEKRKDYHIKLEDKEVQLPLRTLLVIE
jgi:small subunit ribosomal protein S4e